MTVEVDTPLSDPATGPAERGAPTTDSPVRRVLEATPLVVLLLMLAVVLRYSALHLGNQDTWFHLVLGDRFRSDWSLRDPGSLTRFGTSDWVPTQWSTEILASLAEDWFGLPGVAWLFGACYLALVLGTYLSCRRRGGMFAAAVPTLLVVLAAAPVLSARPQIVSLLLLGVTVGAWLRTADDGRPRWWLVPLTWVWATAHGLWSMGVLLGFVAWLGLVLDRRVSGRPAWRLLALPVLCLLAALVTPVGPRLLTSQLAVSARTSMIAEWGPTSFRSVPTLSVALMLGLLAVLWARRGRVSWTRLLLFVLAAGWTVWVTRLAPLGAIVVAPLLAEALHRLYDVPGRRPTDVLRPPRWERLVLATAAVVYLAVLAVAAPRVVFEPDDVPTGLAGRLDDLPAGSTVLVEDGIGGWIEWEAPQVDPVLDGMLDAYPVGYMRDFFAMTRLKPGWRDFVEDSGARVGILRAGSPLAAAVEQQLGWRVVQRDGPWVLLGAPAR